MDVSEYQFNDDEITQLNEYRDLQPDARLKVRFIAILMLAEGVEPYKIASILGKSLETIENRHNQYLTKGIASLNSFQYKPKQSFLSLEHPPPCVSIDVASTENYFGALRLDIKIKPSNSYSL